MRKDSYQNNCVKRYLSLKGEYRKMRNEVVAVLEDKFADDMKKESTAFINKTEKFLDRLEKFHLASINISNGMYDAGDKVNNLLETSLNGLSYLKNTIRTINPRHVPDGCESAKEKPLSLLSEHVECEKLSLKHLASYALYIEETRKPPSEKHRH